MTDSYDEIEARIQAALAFISREENPNITKLAQDYAVSESRLQARHKERKNRLNCEEADCNLIDNQELALCHIIECEKRDETELHH